MKLAARSDVELFRALLAQRMGLHFDDGKFEFLTDVLRRRIEQTRCGTMAEFLRRAEMDASEFQALAQLLTVAETYFFRNPDHFRALLETALPACIQSRGAQRQLRILSAGCASGEEAYSLAILLHERFSELAGAAWSFQIQGIDINAAILARARKGRYSTWSLRATPDDVRGRWFQIDGREFILDPRIRALVSFELRNLVDDNPDFWAPQSADIVFCRNVTMYFSPEVTRAVIARIARTLRPGGFLFLGHAETLRGISHDFHLCNTHETFYYQRRDPGNAAAKAGAKTSLAFEQPLPAVSAPDGSGVWVDAIQHSSERIAALALAHGKPAPPLQPVPAVTSGLGPAQQFLYEERFNDAMRSLDALPGQGKDDPDGRLLRAVILTNSGDLPAAEAACREILSLDELNAGAHFLLAMCSEHAGDRAAATDHNQAAVYLDSTFAMPHFHLGLLAKRSGDWQTARRELFSAAQLLACEVPARILLFGGGFTRDALVSLCQSELRGLATAAGAGAAI